MDKFTLIRMVDSGNEDYSLIWEWYEQGNYEQIANYLKEWDYGEYYEESEPRLAPCDYTLYQDQTYLLIYNSTIGGTFALFAKLS